MDDFVKMLRMFRSQWLLEEFISVTVISFMRLWLLWIFSLESVMDFIFKRKTPKINGVLISSPPLNNRPKLLQYGFVRFLKPLQGRSFASAAGFLTESQKWETSYAQRLTSIQFDVSTIDLTGRPSQRQTACPCGQCSSLSAIAVGDFILNIRNMHCCSSSRPLVKLRLSHQLEVKRVWLKHCSATPHLFAIVEFGTITRLNDLWGLTLDLSF